MKEFLASGIRTAPLRTIGILGFILTAGGMAHLLNRVPIPGSDVQPPSADQFPDMFQHPVIETLLFSNSWQEAAAKTGAGAVALAVAVDV